MSADLDLPCDQGVGLPGAAFVLAVVAAMVALAVAVGLTLA